MDSFQFLKERIAGFPGYGDGPARRRSDEMIRAAAGEVLAELQAGAPGTASASFEDALLRAEFADQAGRAWLDGGDASAAATAVVADADRALWMLAERARQNGENADPAAFEAAFDARERAMREAISGR